MPAVHAKRIRISSKSYKDLCEELKEDTFTPKRRDGFVLIEASPIRLVGKYVYPKLQKIKGVDPESLETVVEERRVLATAEFSVLPARGLILAHQRRGDIGVIEEAIGAYAGIQAETEDLNSSMVAVYRDFRDSHGKVDLKAVRIRDYFGREGLVTTANFKLAGEGSEEGVFAAWAEEIIGFTATMLTGEGREQITVSNKGSVRYSEGVGEDAIETLLGLLTKHHEEVVMETVEI